MADKHPYTTTQSYIIQTIHHFRKSLPATITAVTLKKLGIAPNSESYVLNVLRFLQIIDQEGKRTEAAAKMFLLHDDAAFSKEFGKQVAKSYSELFELHGESGWGLDTNALIGFFRTSDGTSAVVSKLQAATFKTLAAFSGHGDAPVPKTGTAKQSTADSKKAAPKAKPLALATPATQPLGKDDTAGKTSNVGLTVRIEINLPAEGDQETYDRIFRSIRENLLNE